MQARIFLQRGEYACAGHVRFVDLRERTAAGMEAGGAQQKRGGGAVGSRGAWEGPRRVVSHVPKALISRIAAGIAVLEVLFQTEMEDRSHAKMRRSSIAVRTRNTSAAAR